MSAPITRRPRGRPPGKGRGHGRGGVPHTVLETVLPASATVTDSHRGQPPGRGRGRGRGRGNSQLAARKMGDPQPTTEALPIPPKGNAARPHRISGKYNPGDAIVDNAPRRTSEEVLHAKQQAQKKADDFEAAATALKQTQQRKIAELEDDIRRQDNAILARSHRPDLFDTKVASVCHFFCCNSMLSESFSKVISKEVSEVCLC